MEGAEVEEQKQRMAMLVAAPDFQQSLLPERLVCAAYEGAYSRPLIPDERQLQRLDAASIRRFVQQHYSGPRVRRWAGLAPALVPLVRPRRASPPCKHRSDGLRAGAVHVHATRQARRPAGGQLLQPPPP
jgi:hypothetical protein